VIGSSGPFRDDPTTVAANHAKTNQDPVPGARLRLAEVWGDTVDVGHLAWSICLGCGISLGAFKIGQRVFSSFVLEPEIAHVYTMLVGLAGCLTAGVICARLFKPKREVVEHATDPKQRARVLDQLASDPGGLGSIADLSLDTRAEMQELGLLELFAAYERSTVETPAAEPTGPVARALGQGQG
jgi:hypothetical protein